MLSGKIDPAHDLLTRRDSLVRSNTQKLGLQRQNFSSFSEKDRDGDTFGNIAVGQRRFMQNDIVSESSSDSESSKSNKLEDCPQVSKNLEPSDQQAQATKTKEDVPTALETVMRKEKYYTPKRKGIKFGEYS